MDTKHRVITEHQQRQRAISWALRLHIGAVNLQLARTKVYANLPTELINSTHTQRLMQLADVVEATQAEMIKELRTLSELSKQYTKVHPTEGTVRNPGRRRGDKQ